MRRYSNTPPPPSQSSSNARGDIATLKTLLPYLWVYKWRVLAALLALVGVTLGGLWVLATMLGYRFVRAVSSRLARMIEAYSGVWTIALYLTLGVVPLWFRR